MSFSSYLHQVPCCSQEFLGETIIYEHHHVVCALIDQLIGFVFIFFDPYGDIACMNRTSLNCATQF